VESVADARPVALIGATAHFPVPAYLPAVVRPVLPWTRRHVARVSARYHASLDDLWDEALTGLLRTSIHWQPALGAFAPYACTAVHRACWRYCLRGRRVRLVGLEEHPAETAPSAEDEAIAREAARRAWILREHAALAAARGDDDTTSRLRAAASAADRVARPTRRRSSSSRNA
jgi:DNA-directed RNA polymerase specialized sigma24 family protein